MPDGKGGHQDEYLFNVPDTVNAGQGQDKQLMIQRILADNVFPAHLKIKTKVGHCELNVESTNLGRFFYIKNHEALWGHLFINRYYIVT